MWEKCTYTTAKKHSLDEHNWQVHRGPRIFPLELIESWTSDVSFCQCSTWMPLLMRKSSIQALSVWAMFQCHNSTGTISCLGGRANLHPTSIKIIEKIFSLSVFGATFPNPTEMRPVKQTNIFWALRPTASVFNGIWIKQIGAMVFVSNLDKVSLKKLIPTMNI